MKSLSDLEIAGMVFADLYLFFSVKTFEQFAVLNGIAFIILFHYFARKSK